MWFFLLLLFLAPPAKHSVLLEWVDDKNPSSTTYSVHRGDAECTAAPTMIKIASGLTAKTWEDFDVKSNKKYCYTVTAFCGGTESFGAADRITVIIPK